MTKYVEWWCEMHGGGTKTRTFQPALLAPLIDVGRRDGDLVVSLSIWLALVFIVTTLVLVLMIWSSKRRQNPRVDIGGALPFHELITSLSALTYGGLKEGNRIELLQNGDGFFPPLLHSLRNARESIHFETFLWKSGELSRELSSILAERARAGIPVRLLGDWSGNRGMSKEERELLTTAGCKVVRYHPPTLGNIARLNNRDHRKIVVVDGRTAFLGGHCIVDHWLGNAQDKEHFRDVSVRVEGPVVGDIQAVFCENWTEETGEVIAGPSFFPRLEPCGETAAHVTSVTAAGAHSSVELLHYFAIEAAREQILIQNPYFLPDPRGVDALVRAVRRGVRVMIMLPAAEASDAPIVQHASHHRFGAMLKGGIEILEYQRTLLHQKFVTVDHVWSAIGSSNFDDRSFEVNDEVMLGVYDRAFAQKLEAIFESDCKETKRWTLEEWKKRRLLHRLTDFGAYAINEQL